MLRESRSFLLFSTLFLTFLLSLMLEKREGILSTLKIGKGKTYRNGLILLNEEEYKEVVNLLLFIELKDHKFISRENLT